MNNLHKLGLSTHISFRRMSLFTKKIKKPATNLELEVIDGALSNNKSLVQFYTVTCLQEDPVVRAAGLTDLSELTQFLRSSLKQQQSVVLKDGDSGDIVAAASGGPVGYTTEWHLRIYAETKMTEESGRRLVHLWASMSSEAQLLEQLHLPFLWDVSWVATAPQLRGLGLARFLITRQQRLACRRGHSAICVGCSGGEIARCCERAGLTGLQPRTLGSYRDAEGRPWVDAELPDPLRVYYSLLAGERRLHLQPQ